MNNLTINPRTPITAQLTIGSVYEIKFYATKYFEVNSLTMEFLIPKGISIEWCEMSDGTSVKAEIQTNGTLRLSWYYGASKELVRLPFNADELFMTITTTILDTYDTGDELEFVLTDNKYFNEVTGSYEAHVPGEPYSALDMFVVIPELVLESDSYVMPKLTLTQQKLAQGYNSKPIYPVCKNCIGRVGTRCSFGGFITAANGTCGNYPLVNKK